MAIDTAQKRISAMNLTSPWRGPLVDATEAGTTQGNRQAALFMYSGILASSTGTLGTTFKGMFRAMFKGMQRSGW